MGVTNNSYYIGIDITDKNAIISYYQPNMEEPETLSTVAGSEVYQIPIVLAKRKDLGQWYYGDDARKMAMNGEMIFVDNLYRRAVNGEKIVIEEESYKAEDLLALYFKKLIDLPQKLGNLSVCNKLVLTVERLSKENMDMFWRILPKLNLNSEQFMVVDHKESFYYFALSQKEELWFHDVYLFEYEKGAIHSYGLKRDLRTTPQVISITESPKTSVLGDRDLEFQRILQQNFENKIVSTAYLVGDGFDGGWMKNSLTFLCRGRRAFMGKNLFSKGACYAAWARENEDQWPFIYMGENEMKFNLSLKVKNHGELQFYNLISAGRNWFESKGECELILSDTSEIDFWKQLPNSREAIIETLELTDMPCRPDRTTRVRIIAKPVADDKVNIEIKDMGFGELFRATDKSWHYTMTM
ncbi:MAG: DUF5716 family protein [Agathobacter sp.]|nr:DUF5716 family protein [Agathobacter sp.]